MPVLVSVVLQVCVFDKTRMLQREFKRHI